MDSDKCENETELTSTMGNALSMSKNDEKSDNCDTTPTSSTDANKATTSSEIVVDDAISSTSSDNNAKAVSTMEVDMDKSLEHDVDLLGMGMSTTGEKITEDVEDLVQDLETLLGESTDSFNITRKNEDEVVDKPVSSNEDVLKVEAKEVDEPDKAEVINSIEENLTEVVSSDDHTKGIVAPALVEEIQSTVEEIAVPVVEDVKVPKVEEIAVEEKVAVEESLQEKIIATPEEDVKIEVDKEIVTETLDVKEVPEVAPMEQENVAEVEETKEDCKMIDAIQEDKIEESAVDLVESEEVEDTKIEEALPDTSVSKIEEEVSVPNEVVMDEERNIEAAPENAISDTKISELKEELQATTEIINDVVISPEIPVENPIENPIENPTEHSSIIIERITETNPEIIASTTENLETPGTQQEDPPEMMEVDEQIEDVAPKIASPVTVEITEDKTEEIPAEKPEEITPEVVLNAEIVEPMEIIPEIAQEIAPSEKIEEKPEEMVNEIASNEESMVEPHEIAAEIAPTVTKVEDEPLENITEVAPVAEIVEPEVIAAEEVAAPILKIEEEVQEVLPVAEIVEPQEIIPVAEIAEPQEIPIEIPCTVEQPPVILAQEIAESSIDERKREPTEIAPIADALEKSEPEEMDTIERPEELIPTEILPIIEEPPEIVAEVAENMPVEETIADVIMPQIEEPVPKEIAELEPTIPEEEIPSQNQLILVPEMPESQIEEEKPEPSPEPLLAEPSPPPIEPEILPQITPEEPPSPEPPIQETPLNLIEATSTPAPEEIKEQEEIYDTDEVEKAFGNDLPMDIVEKPEELIALEAQTKICASAAKIEKDEQETLNEAVASIMMDEAPSSYYEEEKEAVPVVAEVKPEVQVKEPLSISIDDVVEKEKPYSPKITIKPIKVPDEDISTTCNVDSEHGKGSLRMTITKQSATMHSILKIYNPDDDQYEQEQTVPKLIIKPKIQQVEQLSPKVSSRNSKQNQAYHSPTTSQRSSSPRITIKPLIKPEVLSPLKITIKPVLEQRQKHSPKSSIKTDDGKMHSPRITIKPIPKPSEAEDEVEARSSPKITIKPVIKPIEIQDDEEEVKERIVLKINKGNLPTPSKESSEKLAKIKLKLSKEGHPHIVQQSEVSSHKRTYEETPEKSKKQKLEYTLETKSEEVPEIINIASPILISEDSTQDSGSVILIEDAKDPLADIPVFEISPEVVAPVVPVIVTPTPRKRGRPRKVPLEVREDFKDIKEEFPVKEEKPVRESGRPKRSCRGQNVRETLGIKPRKSRGGRGAKGGKRGGMTRNTDSGEQKPTKAKLKLLQESVFEQFQITPTVVDDDNKSPTLLFAHPLSESSLSVPLSSADSSDIVMVDEETRMSADTSSRAQTPAKQVVVVEIEESQSSVQSTATTESGRRPNKTPRMEIPMEPEGAVISADQLAEYYWGGNGPFMLQEQVAQFLGIKSFKRKYPGMARRFVDMQERDFIRESLLASEAMCDLGLTAVNSADVLDIMYSDFQDKYEEYCKHQRDRQAKELTNKQRALSLAASQEKNKLDITEQAVQSAASWNITFNKTRKEQRKACMDLQTLTVHYPKGTVKQVNKAKVGNYPVALVPGQFTDYYQEFTPTEINNLPLSTMCYDPINKIMLDESDESEEASDSDTDGTSSSSDSSDSSSGVEDCKLCKPTPAKRLATAK